MDAFLMKYLRSGNAFLVVGSGPSTQMGYPSWSQLALSGLRVIMAESEKEAYPAAKTAYGKKDYPEVFEIARESLGNRRLLDHLLSEMKRRETGRIYELLARWPIPVYLTTNYDDEIQNALASLSVPCVSYSNSQDHMSLLSPSLRGAIFKLHGDLRSQAGLILTSSDYLAIQQAQEWSYWRSKLTAVFQLSPVVIIGHSLTDPNIRHVLSVAQEASGVHQPICWIAPDVGINESKEYLEKKRIRVIPYDNSDGSHVNLLRLIETISQFVFSRTELKIRSDIAQTVESSKTSSSASSGFYVFNQLVRQPDFESMRSAAMCGAILSVVPMLEPRGQFSLDEALQMAGWPTGSPIPPDFADAVVSSAKERGIVVDSGALLALGPKAEALAEEAATRYRHSRTRFKEALCLRIKRSYASLSSEEAESLANDIENSLVGFFREAGLGLATTLLSRSQGLPRIAIPLSITRFMTEAASQYDDLLRRSAFSTVSVDIFAQPEDSDREYIGQVSQGFFAFHVLGLLGDAALERISKAKDTVWIIDSSVQIPLLALAAPSNSSLRRTFDHLRRTGIRFFSTEKLFHETWDHYVFADKTIELRGVNSQHIMDAALGQAPFRKTNQFLQGFINWRAAGNPADWSQYNVQSFGSTRPKYSDLKKALARIGVEVVRLDRWPGFYRGALSECQNIRDAIMRRWEEKLQQTVQEDDETYAELFEKVDPEAEVLLVVKNERTGAFNILSAKGAESPAYFVSQTSMLNYIIPDMVVTWQPEPFVRFAATLTSADDPEAANTAFDSLLVSFMQAGVSLMDEESLVAVFGGVIDEASLSLESIEESYKSTIAEKYGETPESVLARLPPVYRPLGAVQLAEEVAHAQTLKAEEAMDEAIQQRKRAESAEKKLERYSGLQQAIAQKRRERKLRSRKRTHGKKKRKKKKRK